ncbi:MAG: hypothetical protein Q9162_002682 [Coniocarpon cinnabarinum]
MPSSSKLNQALELIKQDESKLLGLRIDERVLSQGDYISKMALDPDALTPTFNFLAPILHWIQPGLQASNDGNKLTTTQPATLEYVSPGPPPFGAPHRYVFLLYEQSPELDVAALAPKGGKDVSRIDRMRYDFDAVMDKVGLGQPVAVNYFTCN